MGKRVFFANAALQRLFFGLFLIFILLFLMVFNAHAVTTHLYAKPTETGTGNCFSWANACTLQEALGLAASGAEIWVASGVHYPGEARDDSFAIERDVAVYGGFAGTETLLSERDWVANPTVLSGDIDDDDANKDANGIVTDVADIQGDNSEHILMITEVPETTIIDGFIINAGQADNEGAGVFLNLSYPTLKNLVISANTSGNSGAGMMNVNSSPKLINVAFLGNSAANNAEGGGMLNLLGNPTLSNVLFRGNYASMGAGFASLNGLPSLTNATFSGNSVLYGGALRISGGTTTLTNSIIWGNSMAITAVGGGAIDVSYSIVEGGYTGTGILNEDPLFVSPQPSTNEPTTSGDYHLSPGSPAIDSGNNSPVIVLTDLDGNQRIIDGDMDGISTVDLGAYEWQIQRLFLPLIMR